MGHHPVVLVVGLLGVAQHEAIRHARGAHDDGALGTRVLQRLDHAVGHRAIARAGMDDGLGAAGHQGVHGRGLHVAVGVDDVHLRQGRDGVDVELGLVGVALDRGAEPVVLALHHHAQRTPLALEGAGLDVDVLVHVAGGVDLVVHGDEHALALGVLGGGHAHGVDQVQRAIGRQRGSRAHGADHGDRLVGVHRQAQEVGGLGQGVGTVGDDDAVHVALLGQLRHTLRQLEQVLVGETLGGDLEHLLARHLGDVAQFRQAGQQLVHRHLGGRVGGTVHGRRSGAGNGATGGQHHDMGLGGGLGGGTGGCRAGVLRQAQCRGAGDTGEDDGRGHQGFAQGLEGHVWIPIKKTAL